MYQDLPDWQLVKNFIVSRGGIFAPSTRYPERWSYQLHKATVGGLELVALNGGEHHMLVADYRYYAMYADGVRLFPLFERWRAYYEKKVPDATEMYIRTGMRR